MGSQSLATWWRSSQRTSSQVDYLYAEVILVHECFQTPGRTWYLGNESDKRWCAVQHAYSHYHVLLEFSVEVYDPRHDVTLV